MKLAHIVDGRVHSEASDADASLVGADGKPLFDIRNVASVPDIAIGWIANEDGTYTASEPPAPPPAPVPDITAVQAQIQCLRTKGKTKGKTLLDDVNDAAASVGGEAALWFAKAPTWRRDVPYLADLFPNLSASDLDDLFRSAKQIDV